ncbi:MAG: ATP-binding cassette domain-containing protein [Rhodovibrio sp.]|nr:ATP-binding cassette domain-containing protein [Rhodovibrio sp.]
MREQPKAPALQVDGLTFARPTGFALADVSFRTRAGRVTVLLGPNGAGKTTLVQCLCGLLRPHAGSVRVLDHDLARARAAALGRMGLVLQEPSLDLDLSVQQNLIYFAALHGHGPATAKRRGGQLLAQFGLSDLARRTVRSLSGGQRRRVELVRALLNDPPFLLLDEPTVGLDIPSRKALVAEVHRLAAEQGTSVLWTTHLIDEVWPDDDLVVLAGGRIAAAGTMAEVLDASGAAEIAAAFDRLTAETPPQTAGGAVA